MLSVLTCQNQNPLKHDFGPRFGSLAEALTICSSKDNLIVRLLKLSGIIDDLMATLSRTFDISARPTSFGWFAIQCPAGTITCRTRSMDTGFIDLDAARRSGYRLAF